MFLNDRVSALQNIFNKSPYFEYLIRNAAKIGFKFENGCVLLTINHRKGTINLNNSPSCEGIEPELWVGIDEKELMELVANERPLSKLTITTSGLGQALHPIVETIIQRIFTPPQNLGYPLSDRVELVYGGLFGFQEPELIWQSPKNDLVVLKYGKGFESLDVYVTSGFTNPNIGKSKVNLEEGKTSGYGYELIIFAAYNDAILVKEFVDWVKYIDDTGNHIYQGQYLEYHEGMIPGTNLAGFIILGPLEFPDVIPVADGFGTFNMLIGITQEELEAAKNEDIYVIADRLFENDYINYSPVNRGSLL